MKRTASLLCVLALATRAHAQPAADDVPRAETAMARGVEAATKGDDVAALAAFREAQSLAPNANVPHKLAGETLQRMGRYVDALEAYRRYLAVSPSGKSAGEIAERIDAIEREHIATLAFTCTSDAFHVSIDGSDVGTMPREPMRVEAPKRYAIHVSATGHVSLDKPVDVTPGARIDVDCALAPVDLRVHEEPRPSEQPPAPTPSPKWFRRPLVVGGIVGAAVAVVSVGLYLSLAGGAPSSDGGEHPLP